MSIKKTLPSDGNVVNERFIWKLWVPSGLTHALITNMHENLRNAIYAPQANASEQVNRSIASAIRAYINSDQRDWDKHLSAIECSLRSTMHSSTGFSPYFSLFGNHMIAHASANNLAKKFGTLENGEVEILPRDRVLEMTRDSIKNYLHRAYKANAARYNTRSRELDIYRAKLCKKFLKCRVVRAIGKSMYEIENINGKSIGIYYAKDLQHIIPSK